MGLTMWAIVQTMWKQLNPPPGGSPNYGVFLVALALFVLGIWLSVEGILKAKQLRHSGRAGAENLDVAGAETEK